MTRTSGGASVFESDRPLCAAAFARSPAWVVRGAKKHWPLMALSDLGCPQTSGNAASEVSEGECLWVEGWSG